MSFKTWIKRLLIVPPIIVGVAVMAVMVRSRAAPERIEAAERVRAMRVIEAPVAAAVPRALGYGRVKPARVWTATAQVAGEIVETHPRLRNGAIILKDELLLRIDPTDYRLAIRTVEADLQSAAADLANLEARAANTRASLAIERRAVTLAEQDLARKRDLARRGTAAAVAVDQAETTLLASRQKVQSLENELALVPSQRAVIEARQAQLDAQLESARHDLARTEITAPFDLLVTRLAIEARQAVTVGQQLFGGDGIATAEIEAQVPIGELRKVMAGVGDHRVTRERLTRFDQMPVDVTVRLPGDGLGVTWTARPVRLAAETVDPQSRTAGIIVAVDDPYTQAVPGERPPLFTNMFVEVEFRGRPRPPAPILPRTALHGGVIYTVAPDDRLAPLPVTVSMTLGDIVTLAEPLPPGTRVIVSDPAPAITGQRIAPIPDPTLSAALISDAQGIHPLR